MISFSDAEISKKIVYNTTEVLLLLGGKDDYLKNIIKSNQQIVDSYNIQNLVAIDITKIEIGSFNSTVKKVCAGYFGKHEGFNLDIDTDKSLLYSYIIHHRRLKTSRRTRISHKTTPLEYATTNIFKTEILNQLINLNK